MLKCQNFDSCQEKWPKVGECQEKMLPVKIAGKSVKKFIIPLNRRYALLFTQSTYADTVGTIKHSIVSTREKITYSSKWHISSEDVKRQNHSCLLTKQNGGKKSP